MNPAQAVERLRDSLRSLYHSALLIERQYDYLRPKLLLEVSLPADDEIEAACVADEPTGHIDVKLSDGRTATHKPFYHWLRESRIEVERFAKAVAEVRSAVAGLPADAMDDKNLPLVQRWSSVFRRELDEVVQWFAHFFPPPLTMPKELLIRQWTLACKRNAMPPDWPASVQDLLRFDPQLHAIWQGYKAEEDRQEEQLPPLNAESDKAATPQAATEPPTGESSVKAESIKPSALHAYRLFNYAAQELNCRPSNLRDDEAYKWLCINEWPDDTFSGADEYELPSLETWKRYLGAARQAFGELKRPRRQHAQTTRSVVRIRDLDSRRDD